MIVWGKDKFKEPVNACAWNRWFAWYPVHVEGSYRWLETVMRKKNNGRWRYWPEFKSIYDDPDSKPSDFVL